MLAGIRINHQRQRRQAMQMRQRGGGVLQRDTVNSQRHHLRIVCQHTNYFPQRRAVAEVLRIAQGKREPRPRARIRGQQLRQRFNLGEVG